MSVFFVFFFCLFFFGLLADLGYLEARGATEGLMNDYVEGHLPTRNNHRDLCMSKKHNFIVLSYQDFWEYLMLKLVLL